MSDNINKAVARLGAAAKDPVAGPGGFTAIVGVYDLRSLLDDHARLHAAQADALKAMRQAVIALAHAQESDPVYQNAYGVLAAAIDAAKAVQS